MTELAAAIAVAGAALAAAFGNQAVIVKTIESMTRQPEMSMNYVQQCSLG